MRATRRSNDFSRFARLERLKSLLQGAQQWVSLLPEVERQRMERERQEAERARLAKLEALAKREPQIWREAEQLLAKRNASGYDEGVAHLVELRDLAIHRKERAAFDARLTKVLAPYENSPALQRRLREKKLV